MAFEPGNKHGAKSRAFDAALKRAIAQDDGKRLRAAAEKLLDLAAAGESWAVRELADRLDGKPNQSVDVTHSTNVEGLTLSELRQRVADALAASGREAIGADVAGQVH